MKKNTAHIVLIIVYFICSGCAGESKPKPQPPQELLEKDKLQIAKSYTNLIETCRLQMLDSTYNEEAYGKKKYFLMYASDAYNEVSTIPTATRIQVTTDTIVYNSTKDLCVALLIIKSEYKYFSKLRKVRDERPYDACAVIGRRDSIGTPFAIYPIYQWSVLWVSSYDYAKEDIRRCYFERLRFCTGSICEVFKSKYIWYNLGHDKFFEKAPYFQKYDSVRYNFQMYRNPSTKEVHELPNTEEFILDSLKNL